MSDWQTLPPTPPQRIGVAADHGGFELKEYLAAMLREAHYEVFDFGDGQPKPDDDYPDFVVPLAHAVAFGEVHRGMAICGSGVGACIAANKVPGVRACLIRECFSARQGVEDDMNVICLGGQVVGKALAWELVRTEFYTRDQQDIPTAWVAKMRNSMASLTPRFSADRSVREYTEQHYLPGAAAYRERAAGKGSMGLKMVEWQHALEKAWPALHFGASKVETDAGNRVFEVEINLHGLDSAATKVELYADGINGGGAVRQEMERVGHLAGPSNGCTYGTRVCATRPATDYTARLIPNYTGVAIPLESLRILWR